jgi:hypothetical protein
VPGAFFLLVLVASLLPVACGGGDEGNVNLAWKQIAGEAGIEDLDSYYFRYGDILIGYEKVPGEPDKTRVERCLQ